MESRMKERFTAPPRAALVFAVQWRAGQMWKAVKRYFGWLADDGGEIVGEFLAAGGLFALWLVLPLIAALICG